MSGDESVWLKKRSTVLGVNWPPLTTGVTAVFDALVRQLEQTQWLSANEIKDQQYRQLQFVAQHAAKYSAHFSRRLAQAGLTAEDLNSSDALGKLPLLGRRDLQSGSPDVYCTVVPPDHLPLREGRTSGSTGEPVVVRSTFVCRIFNLAATLRAGFWEERSFGKRLTSIRPIFSRYVIRTHRGGPSNLLFKTGPEQLIPITMDIGSLIGRMADFRPEVLIVYPNVLAAIVQHCEKSAVRFPGLVLIRSMGETLTPQLRTQAEIVLGARIADNYSSSEVGTIAIQCPDSDLYHIMSENLIVEVINDAGQSCKDGEIGRIVITDLHNFAMPIIRYDIGDVAEVGGICPCGRGMPTLKRIVGRERNLILMPDGTKHYPLVGFAQFRDVAPVVQYQFIQHTREQIEGRLVTERPLTSDEEDALRTIVQNSLGYPFELQFSYFIDRIPRSRSGKFEEFMCKVSTENL